MMRGGERENIRGLKIRSVSELTHLVPLGKSLASLSLTSKFDDPILVNAFN